MNFWNTCVSLSLLMAVSAFGQRPEKPNFVILLADDLGWQDVKCYDIEEQSVFETPYIDALASEGLRFTQGYSPAPTCGPSRVGILSGKFPARAGKTHVQGGEIPKPYVESTFRMMDPYYTGRMELDEIAIPEALASLGYYSGHVGKWHVAVNHNAYPQPMDQGFDWTRRDLGISKKMKNRVSGFASTSPKDGYKLDENGFAYDQTTQDGLDFIAEATAREQPFFCYYASWLVHSPIQIRTERLLEKYAKKMGYDYPLDGSEIFAEGQNNPYYAAMVETFDYTVGRLVAHLKETDDPRWPGHKLIENTYIFMTSDNGGMERAGEWITDNYPLDRGKIRAEEGGTRVPFIVVGPEVPAGETSDVMVNGLDFYPTMLALAGGAVPDRLDGCDISPLLLTNAQDADLVTHNDGRVRDTMYWHFPHGSALHSTIRKNGWKLFRNYDYVDNPSLDEYRLYKLYDDTNTRNDIEEAVDLVNAEPEIAAQLANDLNVWLEEVGARLPHYNPEYASTLANKERVPAVLDSGNADGVAWVSFETDKAAVVHADLIYTLNGGAGVNEEWFRMDAQLDAANGRAEATIPAGTTHFVFTLIDENNFLVSSVELGALSDHVPDSEIVPAYVPHVASEGPAPLTTLADNNLNYTFIYFENGFPTPLVHRRSQSEANTAARENPDLVIQTGYYSLMLDCDDMTLKGYDALAGSDYLTALHEDVTVFTPAGLTLTMVKDGKSYTCRSAEINSGAENVVRLIQSNRFNKRFDHLGLIFEADDDSAPDVTARMEVTAWSDRVVFSLDLSGQTGVTETKIRIESPQGKTHEAVSAGTVARLALAPHLDTKLSAWDADSYVADAYERGSGTPLAYRFDEEEYALHFDVPAENVSYPRDTDRVDEHVFEITNPGTEAANIPVVFEQPSPQAITGTVMTVCEEVDGRPIGIPVQISKNWHGSSSGIKHRGSWLRGYTMLNLKPGETRQFRLRVVFGYWGAAAAISHSQLCLIGWGKNWKWDESALGAWGESFTYDPTLHAGTAFMDDVRPTFTTPMNSGTDHNWTENSGGGDFLVYRDSSDTYRWIKRLKTAYHWVGPNMTEVLYSGTTDDDKIRVTYSSRAVRTMDYHRRFHGYKYEFLEDVDTPQRLVYHQMAADYYDLPHFTNYHFGDGTGVIASRVADHGGNVYKGEPMAFNGRWLAIDDEMSSDKPSMSNRGMILVSSTKNGEDFPVFMHTYGRARNPDNTMFDLSAESVTRSYAAGDVIEGEIEFVMPPKDVSAYWGSDTELLGRLSNYGADAWRGVYDEYRYNSELEVKASRGHLLRTYPIEVQVANSGFVLADLTIEGGGIGHVPIVLKGVKRGLALQAQRWLKGAWVALDTADVAANDDYQGYQNAEGTMDVVFNISRPSSDLEERWRVRIVSGSSTEFTGYDGWIRRFDLSGEDMAKLADPDFDSTSNLYEYGFGGDPSDRSDSGYLPTIAMIRDGGSSWIAYARRKNSEGELSYVLEKNATLLPSDWKIEDVVSFSSLLSLDDEYETVAAMIDVSGKDREFYRFRLEMGN